MKAIASIAILIAVTLAFAQPPGPPRGPRGKGKDDTPTNKTAKASFGNQAENPAPPTPSGLKPIGGRWFVKEGSPSVYFYRDGADFIDLFTKQIKDTNNDGIPDL